MYKILIVDDERNEREGIARLIRRYQFPLEIRFAANGEEALAVLEGETIDILLTDIQMPLMNGIELIGQVNQRDWDPACIIYSAYGEFEYAQNAIRLGVLQYLLKPIRLDEFEKLFQDVFRICEEKKQKREERERLQATLKTVQDEKEARRLFLYLESEHTEQVEGLETWEHMRMTPILISGYSGMLLKYWEHYEQDLRGLFGKDLLLINKGDSQFILLIKRVEFSTKELEKKCEDLIELSRRAYQSEIFIVVGNTVNTLQRLREEYAQIWEQLDYQFFTTQSMVLYNKQGVFRKTSELLHLYFERILTYARLKDYSGMQAEFQRAFAYVETEEGFSSIYIKYNFSEIIKKCCEVLHSEELLLQIVEEIYGSNSISQMKISVLNMTEELIKNGKQNGEENRLVQLTKHMVHERYGDGTLSVASIADGLHVSAAYLSTLFKMETKQTLVRYISQYRMEKAKELLSTTNLKISDIAEKVGYFNTSYFISLFKNYVGSSPAKYREKIF